MLNEEELMKEIQFLPLPLQSLCTVIVSQLESTSTSDASSLIEAIDRAMLLFKSDDVTKYLDQAQLKCVLQEPGCISESFYMLPDIVAGMACEEVANEFAELFEEKYSIN